MGFFHTDCYKKVSILPSCLVRPVRLIYNNYFKDTFFKWKMTYFTTKKPHNFFSISRHIAWLWQTKKTSMDKFTCFNGSVSGSTGTILKQNVLTQNYFLRSDIQTLDSKVFVRNSFFILHSCCQTCFKSFRLRWSI